MIPVQLHLSGFLSYLDPVDVNFDAFDVACISGENGAGKSSLLDAITWVLFGEARRRDDAIINLHATTAEVVLVFDYEGNRYRAQRLKSRNKTTQLEFAILEETQNWRVLTGATLKNTEELIRKTLRLDYETFTNASFFLQGKADQFATQKPSDRKRILSSILGLDVWDEYKEETARRRNEAEKSLTLIEARIQEIDAELDQETTRKQRLAEVEKEFKQQNELFEAKKQVLDQQRMLQDGLKNEERALEKQESELKRLRAELERQNELLKARQQERAGLEEQLKREPEIQAALNSWKQAQQDLAAWETLAANFQKYDKQRHPFLQEIASEQARLETEVKNLQSTAASINQVERALPALKQQLNTAQEEISRLSEQAGQRPILEQDLRTLADERGQSKAENERLETVGKELNKRIEQLDDISTSLCPVCGKPLSESEREKMIADLRVEVQAMRTNYQKNKDKLKDFSSRYTELESQISLLSNIEKPLAEKQKALAVQSKEIANYEQILSEWQSKGLPRLQELQDKLAKNDYAHEARQKLAEVDAQLKALGYDAAAHEAVKQAELTGRASQEAWLNLEKARSALAPLQREIEEAHQNIDQKEAHLRELEKDFLEAQTGYDQKKANLPDLTRLEGEYYTLQETVNRLREQMAQARNEVTVLDRQREKKAQQISAKEATQRQIAQLKLLERAFGKDGIPALLIEQALPEIESNANEILDRLSNGNMAVRFETQREFKDKKREDRKETLDILIRDSQGERDYELFSGGEAFRVNFAIRLALSRVLAHRAGARLQTLVIDEGFGSQDADGIQQLIETINVSRNDFAKVLVITHMENLKDAFPARIEVVKGEHGSQIKVLAE